MKTRRLLTSVSICVLLGAAAAVTVGTLWNTDAVVVIARHVAVNKVTTPVQLEAAILHLIEAGAIHGRIRDGKPLNVWGRRYIIERNDGEITLRSPGLLPLTGPDVNVYVNRGGAP